VRSDDGRFHGAIARDGTLHVSDAPAPYEHLSFKSINDVGVYIGGVSAPGLQSKSLVYIVDASHFIEHLIDVPEEIRVGSTALINNRGLIVVNGIDTESGRLLLILDLLFEQWRNTVDGRATGDINGDGSVDVHDVLVLLAEWTG